MTKRFQNFFPAALRAFTLCAIACCGVGSTTALGASIEHFEIPNFPKSRLAAYPTIDRLSDGRLLCVFSARPADSDNKLQVVATLSDDHGITWSSPEVVVNTSDGHDYDPCIVVIGTSVIVTATTTPLNESGITTSRIMAVRSDDGVRTWSQPFEIPTGRHYTSGKVNRGIVLENGTALLGFTWEKNLETGPAKRLDNEGQMEEVNAVLLSFDRGRTWASSESVELAKRRQAKDSIAINGVCEPALVECSDGSVFMLSRTGLTNLYSSRSHDHGRSWSAPEPTKLTGHNAPAALCRFGGERPGIAVVWNNSSHNRWPLSVAASFDNCQSWSAPRDITDGDGKQCSYPSCVEAADGSIVAIYQQDYDGGRKILGVRFPPAWITNGGADRAKPSSRIQQTSAGRRPPSNRDDKPRETEANDLQIAPHRLQHFDSMPKPVTLSDGTLAALFLDHEGPGLPPTPDQQSFYALYSKDNGKTWSEPDTLFELPSKEGGFGYFVPLVDQQGEIHLFVLCDANTGVNRPRPSGAAGPGVEPLARQRLDVWHVRSQNDGTDWTTPRRIWEGRAGDLQSVTQLSSGRIVLPLSYLVDRSWSNRGEGPSAFTYTGQFDTTVLYSDDGQSWEQSRSVLRTATPNLSAYGAVEPIVLELNESRVWMLLRTQLGRFYESYSEDGGVTWSAAEPTEILSSDSPAALVRTRAGRIVMLWNNCQRHPYAQGSRHVLHAAFSDDDGQTWHGYREVLGDPLRKNPPPPNGDHGVSYPFVTEAADGSMIYSLWVQTGEGRTLEKFHPKWLEATHIEEDFLNGMEAWSTFGTRGVELVPHPDHSELRVMRLCRTDSDWPTTAVWSFPKGSTGRLELRLLVEEDAPELHLELANHFSPPFDRESKYHSLFHTALGTGDYEQSMTVAAGEWVDVELQWDCDARICEVSVNGRRHSTLAQEHSGPGPSYLRLSLLGQTENSNCVLVDKVSADLNNEPGPGETTVSRNRPVRSLRNANQTDWKWGTPLGQPQSAFGCTASQDAIFVVGGTYWESKEGSQPVKQWLAAVWRCSREDQQWQSLPNFPHPIGYALTVLVDHTLYVIGGSNEQSALQTTYALDVNDPQAGWSRGPDLPRPLCRLRGGYHAGTIYALTDEYAISDDVPSHSRAQVLAWDVAAGSDWIELAEGPAEDVGYSAATVCDGKMYVFGGAQPTDGDQLDLLDLCWAFDTDEQRWSPCQPLPLPLRDATATPIDGRYIAIVGGVMDASPSSQNADVSPVILSTQCIIYDTKEDCFELTTPLYQAVADHGLARSDSQLWVVGGEDSIHRSRTNLVQQIGIKEFLPSHVVNSREQKGLVFGSRKN
ncbi:exo-alpha-sialidase [Pirellulales bacterium]|nr:exo-alpha-sialidase [Pirellulales bacterium]